MLMTLGLWGWVVCVVLCGCCLVFYCVFIVLGGILGVCLLVSLCYVDCVDLGGFICSGWVCMN